MIGRWLVPIGILILVLGGGVWTVSLIVSLFGYRKRKRAMQAAIAERSREVPESVGLVSLYMNMVAKHGPNSEEAEAFRFQLFPSDAIREAFELQADIIDDTYRQMQERRTKNAANH